MLIDEKDVSCQPAADNNDKVVEPKVSGVYPVLDTRGDDKRWTGVQKGIKNVILGITPTPTIDPDAPTKTPTKRVTPKD